MSGPPPAADGTPRAAADRRKAERLAEALRANLRKRKTQARERGTPDTPGAEPDAARNPDTDRQ